MISKILSLLIIFFATTAHADKYYFKADNWQKGLHLLAAGGLNGSIYHQETERQDQGIGLNFKTDVGYYFNSQFAWEVSSMVKFNRVKEYLIWDTLFTTGFRYRFNKFPFTKSKGLYARGFYGQAPTVFFLNDVPELYRKSTASRVQHDGPVYGIAFGNMYDGKDNRVWFVEYGLTYQQLERAKGIINDGEVPVTTFEDEKTNNIIIYSAFVSIGILVF